MSEHTRHTRAYTEDSSQFDPDSLFAAWESGQRTLPNDNDLQSSITSTFNLPANDDYTYHATASVTLSQVQTAINHGRDSGLHAWYLDEEGKPLPPPPQSDITAYTTIFASNTSTSKALTSFASNAKKGSLRAKVSTHLLTNRLLPPTVSIPKRKTHTNPSLDFWNWSCHALEWCGPEPGTEKAKTSHHVLPVFMHHFGCVVPSYEGLEVIRQLSAAGKKREVVEIGSGNGYWTYMLRRQGVEVKAVDNLQSEYRTLWIGDTIVKDGEKILKEEKGGMDAVLLLVYPVVGAGFTAKVLEAYKGDTICIAGTQNRNGYTAFRDRRIDEYMEAEKPEFEKTIQLALPSFAGKDEALFVFERRK